MPLTETHGDHSWPVRMFFSLDFAHFEKAISPIQIRIVQQRQQHFYAFLSMWGVHVEALASPKKYKISHFVFAVTITGHEVALLEPQLSENKFGIHLLFVCIIIIQQLVINNRLSIILPYNFSWLERHAVAKRLTVIGNTEIGDSEFPLVSRPDLNFGKHSPNLFSTAANVGMASLSKFTKNNISMKYLYFVVKFKSLKLKVSYL